MYVCSVIHFFFLFELWLNSSATPRPCIYILERKSIQKKKTYHPGTFTTPDIYHPGHLPPRTFTTPDIYHPGHLPPRTFTTRIFTTPDIYHPGQLPPRTVTTQDSYHHRSVKNRCLLSELIAPKKALHRKNILEKIEKNNNKIVDRPTIPILVFLAIKSG